MAFFAGFRQTALSHFVYCRAIRASSFNCPLMWLNNWPLGIQPFSFTNMTTPFHLAFPVKDLQATRDFYGGLLGCKIGRTSERWVDFDFFGHQLSAHLTEAEISEPPANPVDGKQVPIKHFGAILDMDSWAALAERLKAEGIEFIIEPYIRFQGEPGEQGTMFFLDPSGNALEFKGFASQEQIFATE